MNIKITIVALLILGGVITTEAQVGYGFTGSTDLYHYYRNPEDPSGQSRSAGSALLNVGIGPKIWFGGEKFSMSVEGQAVLGIFGLSAGDYKGLGTAAFPLLAKFNFGGLTGLDKEGKLGWSIGAGIQYSCTELYYVSDDFENAGGVRDWFQTYVGQVGYGFGMSGFGIQAFLRGGYNADNNSCTANFGIQYDFNLSKLKEIDAPESRL